MTREMKLQFHLEMVIWESLPEGTHMNAGEMFMLIASATPKEKEAAYQRALTHSPLLLDDERRPE